MTDWSLGPTRTRNTCNSIFIFQILHKEARMSKRTQVSHRRVCVEEMRKQVAVAPTSHQTRGIMVNSTEFIKSNKNLREH